MIHENLIFVAIHGLKEINFAMVNFKLILPFMLNHAYHFVAIHIDKKLKNNYGLLSNFKVQFMAHTK